MARFHRAVLVSAIQYSVWYTLIWLAFPPPTVVLGSIPVHTEYRCLFFSWYEFIPQYRCHLNNVRNATLFERGLFSLLHCGEDTAVCVTKRESSETEAVELVERDETEELIHNIHNDRHKYPSAAISSRITHTSVTLALYLATFRPF